MEKNSSGWKNIEQLISGEGTSVRYSRVGTKFRLKMTLLSDSNVIRTHNCLVCQQTLNHLGQFG